MLQIRALEPVEPARLTALSLVTNNLVLPALRNVIGPELAVPEFIMVVSGETAPFPDGLVETTADTSGLILEVNDPQVRANNSDEIIRFAVAHEMAHFHELTKRKVNGIRIRNLAASELWSEYYAQRVCWRAGFMSSLLGIGGLGEEDTQGSNDGDKESPSPGFGKLLAWVAAHRDTNPNYLESYPQDTRKFLASLLDGGEFLQSKIDSAYRTFPTWSSGEEDVVNRYFRLLSKVGKTRRRSRR